MHFTQIAIPDLIQIITYNKQMKPQQRTDRGDIR